MAVRIIIDIDVKNPEEVIKAHKGQMLSLLSDVMMSKNSKKKKVNYQVAEEIVAVIETDLPRELRKEMVNADLKFTIVQDVEMDEDTTS